MTHSACYLDTTVLHLTHNLTCWSVQARFEAVETNQDHTVMMGLEEEGDDTGEGAMTYSLGQVQRFLLLWPTTSDEAKSVYHTIIRTDTKVRIFMRARAAPRQT